ncbi:MAG: DNA-binding protein [Candidatus Eremiobacteraeota bacterium]|nr:DNA-binding protein [Candidatus Eremiobacteraeota bacterium]
MEGQALRLGPGQDLKKELIRYTQEHHLEAGAIVTCVGSLERVVLRLADQPDGTTFEGKFEIVSLVGTLSPDGVHLHMAVSDSKGHTVGGHLMEGCRVYTTAEIVIAELKDTHFRRVLDPRTGYPELDINP